MKIKNEVKTLLKNQPLARERHYRARAVWAILFKRHGYDTINKQVFCELFAEIASIDRWIRKVQEEDETLRGDDYGDKKILEQEKMLELGYEVGYYNDMKRLNAIKRNQNE